MPVFSCPNACKKVKLYNSTDEAKICVKHDKGEQEFIVFVRRVWEKLYLINYDLFFNCKILCQFTGVLLGQAVWIKEFKAVILVSESPFLKNDRKAKFIHKNIEKICLL